MALRLSITRYRLGGVALVTISPCWLRVYGPAHGIAG